MHDTQAKPIPECNVPEELRSQFSRAMAARCTWPWLSPSRSAGCPKWPKLTSDHMRKLHKRGPGRAG